MVEFLFGEDLADRIRGVGAGRNVQCAVAFWGSEAFPDTNGWQIICDIYMGGTSAEALRSLGAPRNKNLRHLRNLHAKVYISDQGAIIGSANASQNALGRVGAAPNLTEAGIFVANGSAAYDTARAWFNTSFAKAHQVQQNELQFAYRNYHPQYYLPTALGHVEQEQPDLIDRLIAEPYWFVRNNIAFIISGGAPPPFNIRGFDGREYSCCLSGQCYKLAAR